MKNARFILCLLLLPMTMFAQREADVHGKSVLVVTDHDNITLAEAKRKCVEKAKVEALKEEFGEMVASDAVDINVESNGSVSNSSWENTAASAKADWMGDTRAPIINVEYKDGNLIFSAEVWGRAREIVQAKTDIDWVILKDVNGKRSVVTDFESGERIYMRVRVPVNGYVAVYLTDGDGNNWCLLPYPKDSDGRFPVIGGRDCTLFDKEIDPMSPKYNLTTSHAQEKNQLVVIYSPHAFVKCNDISKDPRHPGSVSTADFQKWLLKSQRNDKDMVVDKKWVTIHNSKVKTTE